MTTIILLILLKICVSTIVVKVARYKGWRMIYVVPVMAALWVPIVYLILMRYVL